MYMFSARAVAQQLKTNAISESAATNYLALFTVFQVVGMLIICATNQSYAVLQTILSYSVFIGGLYAIAQDNRAGDNKEYLKRFVCLTIPLNFRLLAIMLMYRLVFDVSCQFIMPHSPECKFNNPQYLMAFDLFLCLLFLYWMRQYIKYIAQR